MFFLNATFIGIDPTAGEKPFVYAAINHKLKLLALDSGNIDDTLAFCAGQRQAIVAVCAPQNPNIGLMKTAKVRDSLSPKPNPGRWENFRVVEYLLRQHNIRIPQTPALEVDCPNWMKMGFLVFERLRKLGYKQYPNYDGDRQYLEVYPYACYTVLLQLFPFHKNSLEGRLQRQLVLFENRMDVPDPWHIFEEITRYRLLSGVLPLDNLYSPEELDALVAAYTAWMVVNRTQEVKVMGDKEEGQVVLPVPELCSHYHNSRR